jgi:hypothetical protein
MLAVFGSRSGRSIILLTVMKDQKQSHRGPCYNELSELRGTSASLAPNDVGRLK